jgi:hypothetical protein
MGQFSQITVNLGKLYPPNVHDISEKGIRYREFWTKDRPKVRNHDWCSRSFFMYNRHDQQSTLIHLTKKSILEAMWHNYVLHVVAD